MLQPAPLITAENANKMREKGLETRFAEKNRIIRELEAKLVTALASRTEDDLRRKERLLGQVKKCDDLIEDCDDPKEFVQLVQAKARLWELLYPKPGSLRPKQGRQERAAVQPLQESANVPLVVSPTPISTDSPQPGVSPEKG